MQQEDEQLAMFEHVFSDSATWKDIPTPDPFLRYVTDRRLKKALQQLKKNYEGQAIENWSVLIVCGGVGSEALFFLNHGFTDVTNSDFSENAVKISREFDTRIKTLVLNAESIALADGSYDLVIVRDGLHHLTRPVLGFTEMLRVAKRAVVVIEPYDSLVGNLVGKEWEELWGATNFVFRWNKLLIHQVVKSYLLKNYASIQVIRLWDHHEKMEQIGAKLPSKLRMPIVKMIYGFLSCFNFVGNMMIAMVYKN